MEKIAIIMTCYNRKEKTLKCLSKLFQNQYIVIDFDVFLTDDGSTDGTSEAVHNLYPSVKVLSGNGKLFWAGGMNLAWNAAIRHGGYDGFLWLNDDTVLLNTLWSELLAADEYSLKNFGKGGIYIGSTLDMTESEITYGGWRFVNKIRNKLNIIKPNGTFVNCQIGNGNVTYVSKDVVRKLGSFYPKYVHGADFDYTYWAYKNKFPVFILRKYVGLCDNDHKSHKENLLKRNLWQRIQYLYSPTGMQMKTALLFQKRFFWYRVPYLYITYWIKALCPKFIK